SEEEKPCLSYLNKNSFECVDEDTSTEKSTKEDSSKVYICGETPHLSSFAILLTTSTTSSCADNQAFFYTAIGFIIFAFIIFLIAIFVYEIFFRLKRERKMQFLSGKGMGNDT